MLSLISVLLAQTCTPLTSCDAVIPGQKVFGDLVQFYGAYPTDGVTVSAISLNGMKVGGPVIPTLDGTSLRLRGSHVVGDAAPDVMVESSHYRDTGGVFGAFCGDANHSQQFALDHNGDVIIMPCPNADGSVSANAIHHGTVIDGSGISGHWSATVLPRYYYGIAGRLSENHLNAGLDGGCNTLEADGGCYASFTALHGELTVLSTEPRPFGGWGLQYVNPVTDGTGPDRFFVDVWGGIGQRHMMIRAQFPPCPADLMRTMPQTQSYFNGAIESTQLYAFDEHEWYFCDGTDWQPMRAGSGSLISSTAGRSMAGGVVGLLIVAAAPWRRRG